MSLLAALAAPFLKGAKTPRRILALGEVGRPQWTPRDYAALAREGYGRNAVVHRCVRLVAEGVGALKPVAMSDGREVADHPALALLARPNGHEAGPVFLETLASHLMLAGNAYVEAVRLDGKLAALQTLRPDRTRVVPGPDGWPAAYEQGVGASLVRLGPGADGRASVLHLRLFHPTNDHYGMAPLEAAQVALDVLNAASAWNKALLDNAARPSGALVYAPASGASLSREQFERLKEELEASYQGAGNAGRPLLLEGGLDWKPLALTPRELDFVETRNAAAREVALAFGVPPLLLGLPGDATYANYQEANRAFVRQTVLPLGGRILAELAAFLAPDLGAVELSPDLDAIEALHAEREALWRRVERASFLTDDEKRAAVGYGART
jgi:HK97 family phage portal protein